MGQWLDRLKKAKNVQPGHPQNVQNRPETGFDGFVGTSPARSQTLKRRFDGSVGRPVPRFENPKVAVPGSILGASSTADPAPANSESVGEGYQQNLQNPPPTRLAIAAVRVCREIHGDSDEQVQAMLDDLASHPPEDWDALTQHFEVQLSPPHEPGRNRITVPTAGFQSDMPVSTNNVAALPARASMPFTLKDNGGGGSLLGEPGKTEGELRAILVEKYGKRLATINGEAL